VLHTWGRQLQYHPHIHYLAPGGALSSQDGRWHASSPGFYLPVHALSAIFRAKFRDAMDAQGLLDEIPAAVWELDWNVISQAVGHGQASLKYLARYVFKVAISDSRIVRFDDTEVVFRYRKVHSNRVRTMALPVFAFMHRFLQHVLPTGFMKVRYTGLSPPASPCPWMSSRPVSNSRRASQCSRLRLRSNYAHQCVAHSAQVGCATSARSCPCARACQSPRHQ
jgi:hypothetical protein